MRLRRSSVGTYTSRLRPYPVFMNSPAEALRHSLLNQLLHATSCHVPAFSRVGPTHRSSYNPCMKRRVARTGVLLLFFAAVTAAMTYPQARYLGSGVPDMGDPLFSVWRIAWVAHQLPREPLGLFDANIFYPERLTLAYSDAMLAPAIAVAPLLWLGVHQLTVYNLLFLSAFVLSGASMFLLVRSLTNHTGAALVAGVLFAFAPFRFGHYPHLELQMSYWMPLGLWALHRMVERGRLLDGVAAGAFAALQVLSCVYYGVFFATWLVPVGVVLVIARADSSAKSVAVLKEAVWPTRASLALRRVLRFINVAAGLYLVMSLTASLIGGFAFELAGVPVRGTHPHKMFGIAFLLFACQLLLRLLSLGRERALGLAKKLSALWFARTGPSITRPLVAGAALAAVLVVPYVLPYAAAHDIVGERDSGEMEYFSAEPLNYLAAPPGNGLYGRTLARFGEAEKQLFPGLVLTVLALAGAWPPITASRLAYLLGFFFAFEASLGSHGIIYNWLHWMIPAYRGFRVPARFAMLVSLSLSILAGYGVVRLLSYAPRPIARSLVLILIAVALLEYRSVVRLETVWTEPPAVYRFIVNRAPAIVIEIPVSMEGIVHETKYLYGSTHHWQPLLNGYSGFTPPSYQALLDIMRHFPDDRSVDYLRAHRVRYAIIHSTFLPENSYLELIERLGSRSDFRFEGRFESPWGPGETRVYRLMS
jgi:hypothetical protein